MLSRQLNGRFRAFTLIELLVVISIISVLISVLLPTLSKSREKANDIKCSASMHATLNAVMAYNADVKHGLQNTSPTCPYWNQGFPDGTGAGSHWALGNGYHGWNEGRAFWPYWRGYLAQGGYAGVLDPTNSNLVLDSRGLGCNANNYANRPATNSSVPRSFWGSYNGGNYGDSITFESNFAAKSYASNPAYNWVGPGIYDNGQTAAYYGNIYVTPVINWQGTSPNTISYDAPRGPLLACPNVSVFYNGVYKLFDTPHRPNWNPSQNPVAMAYAENVGFTDGSVRFFESISGGYLDPTK